MNTRIIEMNHISHLISHSFNKSINKFIRTLEQKKNRDFSSYQEVGAHYTVITTKRQENNNNIKCHQ